MLGLLEQQRFSFFSFKAEKHTPEIAHGRQLDIYAKLYNLVCVFTGWHYNTENLDISLTLLPEVVWGGEKNDLSD